MIKAAGWAASHALLVVLQQQQRQQQVSAFVPSVSVLNQSRPPNRQPVVQLQGGGVQGSPAHKQGECSDSFEADHEHSSEDMASSHEGEPKPTAVQRYSSRHYYCCCCALYQVEQQYIVYCSAHATFWVASKVQALLRLHAKCTVRLGVGCTLLHVVVGLLRVCCAIPHDGFMFHM